MRQSCKCALLNSPSQPQLTYWYLQKFPFLPSEWFHFAAITSVCNHRINFGKSIRNPNRLRKWQNKYEKNHFILHPNQAEWMDTHWNKIWEPFSHLMSMNKMDECRQKLGRGLMRLTDGCRRWNCGWSDWYDSTEGKPLQQLHLMATWMLHTRSFPKNIFATAIWMDLIKFTTFAANGSQVMKIFWSGLILTKLPKPKMFHLNSKLAVTFTFSLPKQYFHLWGFRNNLWLKVYIICSYFSFPLLILSRKWALSWTTMHAYTVFCVECQSHNFRISDILSLSHLWSQAECEARHQNCNRCLQLEDCQSLRSSVISMMHKWLETPNLSCSQAQWLIQ